MCECGRNWIPTHGGGDGPKSLERASTLFDMDSEVGLQPVASASHLLADMLACDTRSATELFVSAQVFSLQLSCTCP